MVLKKEEAKNRMDPLLQYSFHQIVELTINGGCDDKLLPVTSTKYRIVYIIRNSSRLAKRKKPYEKR
jgi:hypothetical protein